jgi:hypothetical protein
MAEFDWLAFGAGTMSTAVGGFCTHLLAHRRERKVAADKRRRQFLGFLREWRSELQRISHEETFVNDVWNHYLGKVGPFYRASGEVFGDISGEDFHTLVERLGDLRHEEIVGPGKDTREIIASTIDELIEIARKEINPKWKAIPSSQVHPSRLANSR